jgi:hypothetical protein
LKQKNREFIWDSAINSVCGGRKFSEYDKSELSRDSDILIFLWQDNNFVISKISEAFPIDLLSTIFISAVNGCSPLLIIYSTVHSIHLSIDIIERLRRRSRMISINTKNIRDVFLYNARLKLFILLIIDDYNHYINETDIAN